MSYTTLNQSLSDEEKQRARALAQAANTQALTSEQRSALLAGTDPSAVSRQTVTQAVASGTSGADEALLSSENYAIVQQAKSDFAAAQQQYNAAVASGDTAAAARYQAAMDQAHLTAEQARASSGYSGGADGSLYLAVSGSGGSSSGSGASRASSGSSSRSSSGALGSAVTDLSGYLEQMYAARLSAQLAQLQSAYDQNVAALDRAAEAIPGQYQDARNQTAGAAALAGRNFNEYAAANGLNSGAGGQAELARNVTLQNNLNTIDRGEADALADLELQRAQAELEYNSAIAQARAEGNYQLASALYQEKTRVQNALLQAESGQAQLDYQYAALNQDAGQFSQSLALQQQQYADELAQQQWSNAFQQQQYADGLAQQQQSGLLQQQQYADSLAQSDYQRQLALAKLQAQYGDYSGLQALGVNVKSLEDYQQEYAAARAAGNAAGMKAANDAANAIRTSAGLPAQDASADILRVAVQNSTAQPIASGYNNGSLTKAQVKTLQAYLGVTQDGYYGPATSAAAGGLTADELWALLH